MNKTLRISFSLRNTYRVNGILYSLKQIPLLKRILPQALYRVRGLKVFANVLSALWEAVSVFLGKFLYFLTMVAGIGALYKTAPAGRVYLHILLFLTLIGAIMNTSLFNPTRDKYYAMILMRMNAREYTLVNYFYALLKVILGFLPFSVWFGLEKGLPLWLCLLVPFSVAGVKMAVENPSIINNITKELYPKIAEKCSTTPSKVERAIRHSIEVAFNKGRIDAINSIFGVRVYIGTEKPTNSEFIALLADKLLLDAASGN